MQRKQVTKRTALVIALIMILQLSFTGGAIPASIAAANDYTWNNTIPEKLPAPGTSNGKLVLFDNSHGETAGQADWVLDGAFSDFADDLASHGYTVREYRGVDKNSDGIIRYYDDRQSQNVSKNEAVITYDGIKAADVFVMAEPNRPFTVSERAALKSFVDAGKGIYFISDHYNADRNKNTWDATEVFNGYNRSTSSTYNMGGEYGDLRNPQEATTGWLAETFGVRFRFNSMNLIAGFSGIKSTSHSEGITAGVDPILMAAGGTLSVVDGNKAKGIVYLAPSDTPSKWSHAPDSGIYFGGEAEGPYVAISKPSLGKAAFIGDSSPIEDDTPKYKNEEHGGTKRTHPGYTSAGHARVLSVNIVNWLANTESYVGFDGVNHTKGVNTPTPMADEEKNETQAEPWAAPSYNPWNTDTFAFNSYGAPQGTAVGNASVTGVSLSNTAITLNPGSTQSLTATVAPSNATDKTVTWSTSNSAVATVSNGVVTAKAEGSAVITVTTTDGGKTATCTVTVSAGQASLSLDEGFDSVVGTKSSITSGVPSGWTFGSGLGVYTTTSNYGTSAPSIKMQGTGQRFTTPTLNLPSQGTLSFWLKGMGTNATSHLLVERYDGSNWSAVTDISSLPTNGTVKTYNVDKNTQQLRFTYTKSSGNLAIDDVKIEVTNTTVDVTGVSLDQTSISLNKGSSSNLSATVLPTNADNKAVTWSSNNTAVATVSNGVVTANGAGSAIITVTTVDGSKTATCTVTVTEPQGVSSIDEGFDSVVGSSSSISYGVPEDWAFSSGLAVYNTNGNYGNSAPSLKFSGTGQSVTSPVFNISGKGNLSFWVKGQGTNAASHVLVEQYDGANWTTVVDLGSLPTSGTTKTYSLSKNAIQVRFTYTKSSGNLAFDDVKVW